MSYPIQSLTNMEMQLYGGCGSNMNAPSFINGYVSNSYNNSMYSPYMTTSNPTFGQNVPYNYGSAVNSQTSAQQPASAFQGLSQTQRDSITDFYAKSLEPSESIFNALLLGGGMGALMMNPRLLVHPINTLTTTFGKSDVKTMFKWIKDKPDLWKKHHFIFEEAFSQMHRAEARSKSKLGLFRARYTDAEYKKLKGIMESALNNAKKTGNIDDVAKATETLRHAYCRNGWVFKGWNKVKGWFGKASTLLSVDKMLKEGTETIANNTKTLLGYNKMTLSKAFQRAGGKLGLAFGAVEILLNLNKITTAKQKDKENAANGVNTNLGATQTKQTIIKAIGNTLGWCAGETLAVWAAAKWGAGIGTALGGLPGTVVGAIAGVLGGSIGMNIVGKIVKSIVGEDVSNKVEAQNLAKTPEGQVQLLQYTIEQAQKGKKVPLEAQQALAQLVSQA